MTRTPIARVAVDRLLDGQLEATLRNYRKARITWAGISRLIDQNHGIEIAPSTLRSWGEFFGLDAANGSDAA